MRVLAIDCSAKSVSAAIAEDNKLMAEAFLNIQLTHSETLMPMVEQLLINVRLTLKDIDAFAVTAGPGSFTGVRIGISAIKGMAFKDQKQVYPFSTLSAMALTFLNGAAFDMVVCGLMDARRNQFYNALFDLKDGKITRITDDRMVSYEELCTELKGLGRPVILMGDGAQLFYKLSGDDPDFSLAPATLGMQRASGIAIAAASGKAESSPLSPEALQTVYLRKSQAEREREETLSK